MADRRVYPSKLARRERDLLANAKTALLACNRPDLKCVIEATQAIEHRLACAARYDETREKRLTVHERTVTACAIRGALLCHIEDGHEEEARAVTRALVRLLR